MSAPPSPRRGQVPVGPLVAAVGAVLLIVSLLLVILALATIASLAGGLGLVRPAPSPGVSLAVAIFTVLVVASQVINDPPAVAGHVGPGKDVGIWLALGGAGLMVGGAVLGYARISLAVDKR